MDTEWLKEALTQIATHGPWAILAFFLVTKLLNRPHEDKETLEKIIDSYHEAIVDNTKVTERLALLIEERTRRQTYGRNGGPEVN
jgi:hypothetical protein